ncbi:MAG TPA: hypothetical protein VMA32_06470 [Streptosporangiaceae bacterium]|nr:hypothetical protein [Streptosporangiaceae bacterium]
MLMGLCLALFILAWPVVRNYSTTAAIIMSPFAVLIPPVAAMVANAGDEQRPRQ